MAVTYLTKIPAKVLEMLPLTYLDYLVSVGELISPNITILSPGWETIWEVLVMASLDADAKLQ